MNLLQSAARNISIVAAAQALMWVVAIVFVVAQATYLGPARFGELAVGLSYAGLLTVFIEFGLGSQLSRLVAQRGKGHEEALAATMVIKGALWALAMPLVVIATLLFGYHRELRETILLLAVSVLFISIAQTIGSYLQGHERFLLPAVASVAQRFTAAGVGIVVLLVRPELTAVAGAFVVSGVVNIAVTLVGLRARRWMPIRIDLRDAWDLFRRTVPLGLFSIATIVYWSVDMIMLQLLAPAESVGWYAAAYRLFAVATILPSAVAGIALYPMLSRLSVGSRPELRAVIEKTVTFLTLAGVAASLLLALFADRIIALIYPAHAYAESAMVLRLLAPALLFICLERALSQTLLSLHQERRLLTMAVVAAVLNPLANLVAIPVFGHNGAALTTSLTALLVLVWVVRLMPRDLLSAENLRVATRALLAAGATAILLLPASGLELVLAAPLALVVFGALAVILRAVSTKDLLALLALVRPKRSESYVTGEATLRSGARNEVR
jgi:O-antigen/teichoic acid export membrane protein